MCKQYLSKLQGSSPFLRKDLQLHVAGAGMRALPIMHHAGCRNFLRCLVSEVLPVELILHHCLFRYAVIFEGNMKMFHTTFQVLKSQIMVLISVEIVSSNDLISNPSIEPDENPAYDQKCQELVHSFSQTSKERWQIGYRSIIISG